MWVIISRYSCRNTTKENSIMYMGARASPTPPEHTGVNLVHTGKNIKQAVHPDEQGPVGHYPWVLVKQPDYVGRNDKFRNTQ